MEPIKPSDVISKKTKVIPAYVIEVFNMMIIEKFTNGSAALKQKETVERIKERMKLQASKNIFSINWLDVEDIFRKAGWEVEYDKPGFNESYDATFTFSKKRAHA